MIITCASHMTAIHKPEKNGSPSGWYYSVLLPQGTWVHTLDTFPLFGYHPCVWIWEPVPFRNGDHQRGEEMCAMPPPSISWTFRLEDFPNPSGFTQSFCGQQDRVAVYFRSYFSQQAQQWFTTQVYTAGQESESLRIIIEELNALIRKDSLYDSQVFKESDLSPQTQEAINQPSFAKHGFPINRGLIEDSFIRPWFNRWRSGDPEAFQVCAQWIWARLYRTVEGSLKHMGMGPWAAAEGAVEKAYWVTLEDFDRQVSGGKFSKTEDFFLKSDIRKPALLLNHLATARTTVDRFLHDDFLAQDIPVSQIQQEETHTKQWLGQVVRRLNALLVSADWMQICEGGAPIVVEREWDPATQCKGQGAAWVQQNLITKNNRKLLEGYYPQHIRPIKERSQTSRWGVWTGRMLRKENLVPFEWKGYLPCVAGIRQSWIKDCVDVLRNASRPVKDLSWTEPPSQSQPLSSLSPLEIRNRRESLKLLDRELGVLSEELCAEQKSCTTENLSTLEEEGHGNADTRNPAWRRREFVEHIRIFMKIQVGLCNPTYQNAPEDEIAEYRMLTLLHEADVSQLSLSAKKLKAFLTQEQCLTDHNFYQIKSRLKARLRPLLPWFYRTEQGQIKNKRENV